MECWMSGENRFDSKMNVKELSDPSGEFRAIAFEALVGLVSKRTGGDVFVGDMFPQATETFKKSLIGNFFPSFWMEVPLHGDAGFDLHVYYDRGQVAPDDRFDPGCGFGMQSLFDWFFGVETSGIGVGFAYDLRDGGAAVGAYVNFNHNPLDNARGFFTSLGVDGSYERAWAMLDRLPRSWTPWYLGIFPDRLGSDVRVGSFISTKRQAEYASNSRVLADDFAQAGFTAFDDTMLERISDLAKMPFQLEMQLDATEGGAGDILGADLTITRTLNDNEFTSFAEGTPFWKACELLEAWGIADSRWRLIPDAIVSSVLPMEDEGENTLLLLRCFPAFIKAKWVDARPQPSKVYFECASRLISLPAEVIASLR